MNHSLHSAHRNSHFWSLFFPLYGRRAMFLALYCSGQRVHVLRSAERIKPKYRDSVHVLLQRVLGGFILKQAEMVCVSIANGIDNSGDVFTAGVIRHITFYDGLALSPLRRTACFKVSAGTLSVATHIFAAQG
jgi:hypothetical protein